MKIKTDTDWLDVVKKTVEGIGFGAVTIVIHDARVVQVDRTEKIRFASGGYDANASPRKEEQT